MKRSIFLSILLLTATPVLAQEMIWSFDGDGGYLGVQLRDVTARDVTESGLPSETGAVLTEVLAGSPAADAGLMAGDVVVDVAGLPVLSARHLQRVIADNPPHRTLTLTVFREGKKVAVTVKLGERQGFRAPRRGFEVRPFEGGSPPAFRFHPPVPDIPSSADRPRLGIQGHAVTGQLAKALKLGSDHGILVLAVSPGSPAERAGLKEGDIILKAAGRTIDDLPELREVLEGESVDLEIRRGSQTINLSVKFEDGAPSEGVKM